MNPLPLWIREGTKLNNVWINLTEGWWREAQEVMVLLQKGNELKVAGMLLLAFPHKAVYLLRACLLSSADRNLHQQFLMRSSSLQSFCCACTQEIFSSLRLCCSILTATRNILVCHRSYSLADWLIFHTWKILVVFKAFDFLCSHVLVLIFPWNYGWEYYSVIFLSQYIRSFHQSHCCNI